MGRRMVPVIIILIAGLLSSPHSSNASDDKKALLISVDCFENKAFNKLKEIPALRNDVQLLERTLVKNGYNVKVLGTYGGKCIIPQKKLILKTLEDYKKTTLSHQTLLVLYTGHGKGEYLCPWDFDPSYEESTGLELVKVTSLVKNAGAGKKFLFIDACHSGTVLNHDTKGAKDYTIDQSMLEKEADQSGFYIITSCRSDEQSFVDTKHTPPLSYFTKYLIKGFEGNADGYGNGVKDCIIQISELYRYLEENISMEVAEEMSERMRSKRKVTQRPQILAIGNLDAKLIELKACNTSNDTDNEFQKTLLKKLNQIDKNLKKLTKDTDSHQQGPNNHCPISPQISSPASALKILNPNDVNKLDEILGISEDPIQKDITVEHNHLTPAPIFPENINIDVFDKFLLQGK